MTTPATRIHVRHAGDVPADVLARREAAKAARKAELDARIAASDPALVALASAAVDRGRRRR
jgi:hypothetical protein